MQLLKVRSHYVAFAKRKNLYFECFPNCFRNASLDGASIDQNKKHQQVFPTARVQILLVTSSSSHQSHH